MVSAVTERQSRPTQWRGDVSPNGSKRDDSALFIDLTLYASYGILMTRVTRTPRAYLQTRPILAVSTSPRVHYGGGSMVPGLPARSRMDGFIRRDRRD